MCLSNQKQTFPGQAFVQFSCPGRRQFDKKRLLKYVGEHGILYLRGGVGDLNKRPPISCVDKF